MAKKTTLSLVAGAALATSLSVAHSAESPFAMQSMEKGYMVADMGDKAKEGKCGADKAMDKAKEAKCDADKTMDKAKEGKCGADKANCMDKAKEGKCGADKAKDKAMEGKCGAKAK
jgi:uncharacterized low-complexity protein